MKKIIQVAVASTLFAAAHGAFAQAQPQAVVVAERGPGYVAAAEAAQIQGKVKSVDKKSRFIVVAGPNGGEVGIVAGEEVRNFDQIKVGDLLTLVMRSAIALELKKVENNGIRERRETVTAARAKPGDKLTLTVGGKPVTVTADKEGKFTYTGEIKRPARSAVQGEATVDLTGDAILKKALATLK